MIHASLYGGGSAARRSCFPLPPPNIHWLRADGHTVDIRLLENVAAIDRSSVTCFHPSKLSVPRILRNALAQRHDLHHICVSRMCAVNHYDVGLLCVTGFSSFRLKIYLLLFVVSAGNVWPTRVDNSLLKTRSLAVAKRPCDCRMGHFAKCNWETIYCGHYRSIFDHCAVSGLQNYRIRWNNAK